MTQSSRRISGLPIGDCFPCFIIAEIGQNHQGNVDLAKELIAKAKESGANCVKFQKSSLPDKFTKGSLNREYLCENSFGRTYGEHKAKLELSQSQYKELKGFAESVGIMFTASAMDIVSADFLISLDLPFIKIGSGDTNNFPLLKHVAKSGKPIILSTGMQEFETVKMAVETILEHNKELGLLHCVSSYPTPYEHVNLSVINLYKRTFPQACVGYSGHELGVYVPIAAVALGAKIIEKHFTLDKTLKGTDHKCSLDPSEFKQMVEGIRQIELAMGNGVKTIMSSELPCHKKLGKSIVASRTIPNGTVLKEEDLNVKVSHPKGAKPQDIGFLIGKALKKEVEFDAPILLEDVYEIN